MSAPSNPLLDTSENQTTESTESKVQQESKQNSDETSQTQATETTNTENKSNIEEKKNDSSNKDNENENKTKDNEEEEVEIEKPKLKRCTHLHCMKKKIKQFKKVTCDKCKGGGGNDRVVLCLNCFKMGCSRSSEKQHGLNHWMGSNNNKHNLCMTIPTFEEYSEYPKDIILEMMTIWCYKCDQFLHETDQDNTQKIMKIKYEVYGCVSRSYKNAVKSLIQYIKYLMI